MISPYSKQSSKMTDERLDDHLLMLILVDTLAMLDSGRSYAAERIIEHLFPFYQYDRIMDHYDQLTDDDASEPVVLTEWFGRAAQQDSGWKTAILIQLWCVVAVNGAVDERGMSDMAHLAAAIAAQHEYELVVSMPLGRSQCSGACIRRDAEKPADRPGRAAPAGHVRQPESGSGGSDRPCPSFGVTRSQHDRPVRFSDGL